jgi:hypothetical protein
MMGMLIGVSKNGRNAIEKSPFFSAQSLSLP